MIQYFHQFKTISLFLFVTTLLLLPGTVWADETLGGDAFSDPAYTQAMQKSWTEQTVKHSPEIGRVDLVITLDQHLYPALSQLIFDYGRQNQLKISVNEGTCGITAGKLARKSVDIGGFCCPPGKTDRFQGLTFHTFGITPIALLVHPANDIDTIGFNIARNIFQGELYRWSELKNSKGQPGLNLPIQTIGRLHCKIRPGHWRLLLDNEDVFSPRLQEVGTIPDMISLVANARGAIGYEVMMMVDRYQAQGKVKALSINGFAPTTNNLLTGDYPLYRTLNITTWEDETNNNPHALKLLEYLLAKAPEFEKKFTIVPAAKLKESGWHFKGNELTGEPDR